MYLSYYYQICHLQLSKKLQHILREREKEEGAEGEETKQAAELNSHKHRLWNCHTGNLK